MATIVHFELPADDVDRAKGFWEGVFGWSFQGGDAPFPYLMTQGEEPVGAIYPSQEGERGPVVYMATTDIDATLAKIARGRRRGRREEADPADRLVRALQGHRGQLVLALPGRRERPRRWG